MSSTTAVVFIIVGAFTLILKGILNIGNKTGRGQRFIGLVGEVPARIIYGVVGAALCVIGVVYLITTG